MNAVITGASRGIGKAVARTFAANHYNLYLCSRSEANLLKTIEELKINTESVRALIEAYNTALPVVEEIVKKLNNGGLPPLPIKTEK